VFTVGISPPVEVFLYFFEAKHTSSKLWAFLNGSSRIGLLTLFQPSYKNFKGKFVKVQALTGDPTLLALGGFVCKRPGYM